ncbi:MAG: toxin-antitoxin system HicB family antitoxin [Candidatus Symbiobacter sp.]|nr:toxin-antitoxin system HicB family antitoxin [Candidatus Symbiobacter sp.]
MNKDHYIYRVFWSEEEGGYVGLCTEFPKISWSDDSIESAFAGIRKIVEEVLEDMKSMGVTPPIPFADRDFSGRFMVSIPPDTHRALATSAAESGISLNSLVAAKLAS